MKNIHDSISYIPIGTIHSPYKEIEGVPIQPRAAQGVRGTIDIKAEYVEGLKDLDGFSHILLLYHFHLSEGFSLDVIPFLDDEIHGVFATRAPRRPNSIGISIVKLIRIKGNVIYIKNVDIIDDTPLLDIKPHVPDFDSSEEFKLGWLEKNIKQIATKRSDKRFK